MKWLLASYVFRECVDFTDPGECVVPVVEFVLAWSEKFVFTLFCYQIEHKLPPVFNCWFCARRLYSMSNFLNFRVVDNVVFARNVVGLMDS